MKKMQSRFGLDLSRVNPVKAPFGKGSSVVARAFFLMQYDLLFYLTDGSIFYPTATKNIIHIQSPLSDKGISGISGKIKLSGWDLIIYNSEFTKKNCGKKWNIKSKIIYPPVDIESIKSGEKKKIILSVGRFFGYGKEKKHEVLVDAFADIYKDIEGWTLILAGSQGEGDEVYVEALRKKSKGLPIKFMVNVSFDEIKKLYGEASIYWHAAGYKEEDPAKMEHFGISTVEAMSAGCVPVVIGKGGQLEIVEDKKSGYLWETTKELETLTLKLINDDDLRKNISINAINRSKNFSKKKFEENILGLE